MQENTFTKFQIFDQQLFGLSIIKIFYKRCRLKVYECNPATSRALRSIVCLSGFMIYQRTCNGHYIRADGRQPL
ncbi:unnamed protein product [Acanthoscelides obtectus]|uniref:Uncharacterized protein n=1 Tax=Acanthoscelides obtectus TaxID=200917 RepID=A0A9P0LX95_ACAOB|nr:unnamed protein product [Acanthoscelides obtectus]CAK1655561.1 hypothetical protein AOBTE_LOCUS19218 [Acanthoscelides obtectus]